jgi:hypothetical protein
MHATRPAAVAGTFYSGASTQLAADVRALLAARIAPAGAAAWPKALLVPHAGYVYSGAIAASAYARLAAGRDAIRRVVLLGPAHRVALRGLALPAATAFATPLGSVPVDREAADRVRSLPQVVVSAAVHALEHSLEVQLPFLQSVLAEFAIVPLAVGKASPEEVAAVIELLWGGPETLVVVSSDLSHFHPYGEALEIDRSTADAVLGLAGTLDHKQACGATPINGFAPCARRHALKAELLDLRNSGDTAGDKSRVVGYAAFAFSEDDRLGRTLLSTARRAIGAQLGRAQDGWPEHAALAAPGATFVTLFRRGALRGCIGTLNAHRPLGIDVRANALAAAFRDPRFPALTEGEFDGLSLEVSLLSAPERLIVADEAELLGRLVPGVDGVILEHAGRRATFLPQVWAMLPEPRDFLARLRLKAGMPAGFWIAAMNVYRYNVTMWSESELLPSEARP